MASLLEISEESYAKFTLPTSVGHNAPYRARKLFRPCSNADEHRPLSLPAEFPPDFPLPPGTLIHASRNTGEGTVVVDSVVPADLQAAATFILRELPDAGFMLGFGDGELDEAESAFSGKGYQRQFKVHTILNCPSAVTLTIALAKQ